LAIGFGKLYDLHGKLLLEFRLAEEKGSLLECHFWGNGVAALTSDFTIKIAEVSLCL